MCKHSPGLRRAFSSKASGNRRAGFVITSNRAVEEPMGRSDDPILGNSALARLTNASYQIVLVELQAPVQRRRDPEAAEEDVRTPGPPVWRHCGRS
jgi:hypothetical protein